VGYRSDVRIIVSKDGYEKLKEYVKEHALQYAKEDYDYNLLNHISVRFKSYDDKQVLIGWNYIKWYDDMYEDVKIIMNGLDFLEENDYSYRYARIGENYDDISEHYYDSDKEGYLDYPSILRCFEDTDNGFVEVENNDE
jgi:hypothetical protein